MHIWPTYDLHQLMDQKLPPNTFSAENIRDIELDNETMIGEGSILNYFIHMSDFSIQIPCVIRHNYLLLHVCVLCFSIVSFRTTLLPYNFPVCCANWSLCGTSVHVNLGQHPWSSQASPTVAWPCATLVHVDWDDNGAGAGCKGQTQLFGWVADGS